MIDSTSGMGVLFWRRSVLHDHRRKRLRRRHAIHNPSLTAVGESGLLCWLDLPLVRCSALAKLCLGIYASPVSKLGFAKQLLLFPTQLETFLRNFIDKTPAHHSCQLHSAHFIHHAHSHHLQVHSSRSFQFLSWPVSIPFHSHFAQLATATQQQLLITFIQLLITQSTRQQTCAPPLSLCLYWLPSPSKLR